MMKDMVHIVWVSCVYMHVDVVYQQCVIYLWSCVLKYSNKAYTHTRNTLIEQTFQTRCKLCMCNLVTPTALVLIFF